MTVKSFTITILLLWVSVNHSTAQMKNVFSEDFSDNKRNWNEINSGEWMAKISEGYYHLKGESEEANGGIFVIPTGALFKEDYNIESKFHKSSGVNNYAYALVWNYVDSINLLEFRITGNGYFSITQLVDGEKINHYPWTFTDYINKGNGYGDTLCIRSSQGKICFFINEGFVGSIDAIPITSDAVGFSVYNVQGIAIDWLKVDEGKESLLKDEEIIDAFKHIIKSMDDSFTGIYSGKGIEGMDLVLYDLTYHIPGSSDGFIARADKIWRISYSFGEAIPYDSAMIMYNKLVFNLQFCIPKGWNEETTRDTKNLTRHFYSISDLGHSYEKFGEPSVVIMMFGLHDVNEVSIIFQYSEPL